MIQPKYEIGDVVYRPFVAVDQVQVECPDCLGTKAWEARLPNGEVEAMACPTCTHGYEVRGTVTEYKAEGEVRVRTIGSIRIDTAAEPHRQVQYMCRETGVGSGEIYDEVGLFPTKEEAEAVLPGMVHARQVEWEEQRARNTARTKKDRLGSMVAHYRRQIRQAKKDIAAAERGLAREAAK